MRLDKKQKRLHHNKSRYEKVRERRKLSMDSERESKRKLSVLEEDLGSSDPEELQMEAPAEREVSEEEEPQDPEIHKLD